MKPIAVLKNKIKNTFPTLAVAILDRTEDERNDLAIKDCKPKRRYL